MYSRQFINNSAATVQSLLFSANINLKAPYRMATNSCRNKMKSASMLSQDNQLLKDKSKNNKIEPTNFCKKYLNENLNQNLVHEMRKHKISATHKGNVSSLNSIVMSPVKSDPSVKSDKTQLRLTKRDSQSDEFCLNLKDSRSVDSTDMVQILVDRSEICRIICNENENNENENKQISSNDTVQENATKPSGYCNLCKSDRCKLLPDNYSSSENATVEQNDSEATTVTIFVDRSEICRTICNTISTPASTSTPIPESASTLSTTTTEKKESTKSEGYCPSCDATPCKYNLKNPSVSAKTDKSNTDNDTENSKNLTNVSDTVKILIDKSEICRIICKQTETPAEEEFEKGTAEKRAIEPVKKPSEEQEQPQSPTDKSSQEKPSEEQEQPENPTVKSSQEKPTAEQEENPAEKPSETSKDARSYAKPANFCYECNAAVCKRTLIKKSRAARNEGISESKKNDKTKEKEEKEEAKENIIKCLRVKCPCQDCSLLRERNGFIRKIY